MDIITIREKTNEEKVSDKLREINQDISFLVDVLDTNFKNIANKFFNDQEFTPQEFADVLGVQAQKLFGMLQGTQQFIASIKSDYIPLGLPEIKWSKTGTVEEIIKAEPISVREIV